jgi:hypothetical protein
VDSSSLRFEATIEIYNGNPYVLVSGARAATLQVGWRGPMPVLVQVNGKPIPPWRINMMPIGDGDFYLYLHADVRKVSGSKVGDVVLIEVSFDSAYASGPMHPMPDWFRVPLESDAEALKAWHALIPSRKKEVLRYFSWLKSDAAKQRNVEKALHVLLGHEGRFMARSWKDGK